MSMPMSYGSGAGAGTSGFSRNNLSSSKCKSSSGSSRSSCSTGKSSGISISKPGGRSSGSLYYMRSNSKPKITNEKKLVKPPLVSGSGPSQSPKSKVSSGTLKSTVAQPQSRKRDGPWYTPEHPNMTPAQKQRAKEIKLHFAQRAGVLVQKKLVNKGIDIQTISNNKVQAQPQAQPLPKMDQKNQGEVFGLGFQPKWLDHNHQSRKIDFLKPWTQIDVSGYLAHIDDTVMSKLRQKQMWASMMEIQVPMYDPGLHLVGSRPCCMERAYCTVLIRAKQCFVARAKLMYLFLFPQIETHPSLLSGIIKKIWEDSSDAEKETFYRDNSKMGFNHEYIDMFIKYCPSEQEKKILDTCFPEGVPISLRPLDQDMLLDESYYTMNHYN